MKRLLFSSSLGVLSCIALSGAPCVPGSFQTYINLGATGCTSGTVAFTGFSALQGQTVATPIDPATVQVTPQGPALNPMLVFTLNKTVTADEVFESFFRFSATGALYGASIGLTPPTVTGDGAVTGILDVCPNGSFTGDAPFGCPTSPASLVVFAIEQSSLLSSSANLRGSTSFDVFVDLTIDGGRSGSASVNSFAVGIAGVPEPSAGLLVALGISAFSVLRMRPKKP